MPTSIHGLTTHMYITKTSLSFQSVIKSITKFTTTIPNMIHKDKTRQDYNHISHVNIESIKFISFKITSPCSSFQDKNHPPI